MIVSSISRDSAITTCGDSVSDVGRSIANHWCCRISSMLILSNGSVLSMLCTRSSAPGDRYEGSVYTPPFFYCCCGCCCCEKFIIFKWIILFFLKSSLKKNSNPFFFFALHTSSKEEKGFCVNGHDGLAATLMGAQMGLVCYMDDVAAVGDMFHLTMTMCWCIAGDMGMTIPRWCMLWRRAIKFFFFTQFIIFIIKMFYLDK